MTPNNGMQPTRKKPRAPDAVVPGAPFVRALSRRLAPEQGTSPDGSAVKPAACRPLRR
jgi:hypothetical protein